MVIHDDAAASALLLPTGGRRRRRPPGRRRPHLLLRLLRVLVALGASLLALFCSAVLLGAYVPAIPGIGVLGPVLAGDYPVHVALLASAGLVLALVARRAGLARAGRALTVLTA